MEEDIQYYLPTIMFRGTPCIIPRAYCMINIRRFWPKLHAISTFYIYFQIDEYIRKFVQFIKTQQN